MNQFSRRDFISLGAKTLSGALVLPSLSGLLEGCAKAPVITDLDWRQLNNLIMGEVILPDTSKRWRQFVGLEIGDNTPWALQYGITSPKAIVRCVNEKDVANTIKFARERELPLVARSGGHSYAGFSTTYGILLDLSMMNSINLDLAKGLATLGGGARNRDVYASLREPSLSVTHGRCKAVGVGGLVLGGGIGFNMRLHGLTCDRLVETTMVTADGEIIKCSETENKEIFWALRGAGGGNFGVNTSFVFKPFPVTTVTYFNIAWNDDHFAVFKKLQEVLMTAPKELGVKVSVESKLVRTRPGSLTTTIGISMLGQFHGSKAEFEALIKPVQDVSPYVGTIQEGLYWDAQEFLSEAGVPEYVHERSRFALDWLSDEAINTIFSNLLKWPKTSGYALWKFFLTGGTIDDLAPEATSYFARGAKMITSIDLGWNPKVDKNIPENLLWMDKFHDEMEKFTSKYSYVNFIDRRQKNYLDAYYGPNLDRLRSVKRFVDPSGFFNFPMSIPHN